MKILVIHNILWAHYKSVLFEGMARETSENTVFHVVQIAKNELTRKSMTYKYPEYDYPVTVLFDDFIENIPAWKKTFALFKFILKFNPDIINVTGYAVDPSIALSCFFGKLLGKKIVISNESVAINSSNNKISELIKKRIIATASGFICFGTLAKDYMLSFGVKPEEILEDKAAVIDDVAIKQAFNKAESNLKDIFGIKTARNFIFIGRLIEEKNLELLIRVFDKIKNGKAQSWGLIILGDGELKPNLGAQIAKQNTEDIYFLPPVSWENVSPHFTFSDVLLLPSKMEAWGLVVNEAMICGLPVIVSKNCGCWPDLIDGNGYAIDSEIELESAMLAMLDDNVRRKMGIKSMEIIRDFEVAAVSKRIIKKLEGLK